MLGLWDTIARDIEEVTGQPFKPTQHRSVGGGSINSASVVADETRSFFVKCNSASQLDMFRAELQGLKELAKPQAIRIPQPYCHGIHGSSAYLVLEYIPFSSGTFESSVQLGLQLAELHRYHHTRYGWDRNNTIGSTPQVNTWGDDWIAFYRDHRLGFQVKLARRQGYTGSWTEDAAELMDRLDDLFVGYSPPPSLLHGDLWAGNYAIDREGNPVIFDPAVYYGDRESDLAMTELFGGFPSQFYKAYQESYPLDPGYQSRKPLYKLYHLLNHLNLFGGGYLSQVERTLQQCLKGIR